MSTEVPTPNAGKPPTRSRVVKSNRQQVLLFAILTLILTLAVVWGGRLWLKNSETLVFAVGDANSDEARFAAKLAAVLKNNNSRLRLKIVANADNARAVTQFDRRQADLVVVLDMTDNPDVSSRLQTAPPNSTLDKLLASGGYGAVIVVAHASSMLKDKRYEEYAKRGGFTLNAIEGAKTLARRNPGISEETLATGMLSSAPAIPDDDLDTIGLQWLLVAQSRISTATAGDLARAIYEDKAELALDDGFASKIEPPDTDKDAFIIAHQGAAEYINDETKSFMDRYSDLMYLAAGALSVIGSIFAGIYTNLTRVAPEKASELATAILDIGERIEHATSIEALEALQDELEAILRGAVIGLRDGTISTDGLETFKLGYEFVRDEIGMRRESLKRRAGHDDHVVIVKSAQSA